MKIGNWKIYLEWYPTYWMSHGHFFRCLSGVRGDGKTSSYQFGCGALWLNIVRVPFKNIPLGEINEGT